MSALLLPLALLLLLALVVIFIATDHRRSEKYVRLHEIGTDIPGTYAHPVRTKDEPLSDKYQDHRYDRLRQRRHVPQDE